VQGPGVPITSPRLIILSLVIYHIIKTRGYKTIGGVDIPASSQESTDGFPFQSLSSLIR